MDFLTYDNIDNMDRAAVNLGFRFNVPFGENDLRISYETFTEGIEKYLKAKNERVPVTYTDPKSKQIITIGTVILFGANMITILLDREEIKKHGLFFKFSDCQIELDTYDFQLIVSVDQYKRKFMDMKVINYISRLKIVPCHKYAIIQNPNLISRKGTNIYAEEVPEIEIRYHRELCPELEDIEFNPKGDYVDLRAAEEVHLKPGEFKLISLGVSMKLPKGYYAELVPRSSTFKHFGLIQTNSVGIIDESYCGDNDIWMMPVLATRETVVKVNDRIAQFKIEKKSKFKLKTVEKLEDEDRGGFGSTVVN